MYRRVDTALFAGVLVLLLGAMLYGRGVAQGNIKVFLPFVVSNISTSEEVPTPTPVPTPFPTENCRTVEVMPEGALHDWEECYRINGLSNPRIIAWESNGVGGVFYVEQGVRTFIIGGHNYRVASWVVHPQNATYNQIEEQMLDYASEFRNMVGGVDIPINTLPTDGHVQFGS